MNYLTIYIAISITLIALSLLVLHIYREQIPFLKEDKIEVDFDAGSKLKQLNQKVLSMIKNIDKKRKQK